MIDEVPHRWNIQRDFVKEEIKFEINEKNQKRQKRPFKSSTWILKTNYVAIVNDICSSCRDTVARGQRHHVIWEWQGVDSHSCGMGI